MENVQHGVRSPVRSFPEVMVSCVSPHLSNQQSDLDFSDIFYMSSAVGVEKMQYKIMNKLFTLDQKKERLGKWRSLQYILDCVNCVNHHEVEQVTK